MSFRGQTQTNLLGPELLRSRTFYRDFRSIPLLNPVPSSSAQISFTRSTTATRVNENGLIETVGIDVPRFDYDPVTRSCRGLLIEEGRTNLCLQSNNLSLGPWTSTSGTQTITLNADIAPDGTNTAQRIVFAGGNHSRDQYITVVSGQSYTGTFYVKAGDVSEVGKTIMIGVNFVDVPMTLTNEWQRIVATRSSISGTQCGIAIHTYGGATARNVLVWGFQLEQGTFATSYIPTTTTSIARSAELPIVNNAELSKVLRLQASTFIIEYVPYRVDVYQQLLEIDEFSGISQRNPSLSINANTNARFDWSVNGVIYPVAYQLGPVIANSVNRSGVKWTVGGSSTIANNGVIHNDPAQIITAPATYSPVLNIGHRANGNAPLSGHIRSFSMFNQDIQNTLIRDMTTL